MSLSDDDHLKYHHNLTTVHYGLTGDIDLFGGFRFASVNTETAGVTRSNTGFSDLIFGANYQWRKGRLDLYPGIEISLPLFSIATDTDDAFFNEGASEVLAKLYADYQWPVLDLYGQLALSMLSDGRGGRAYAHLGVRKRLARFLFQFEINGMNTIIHDSLTDQANTRTDVVNRVQGGSLAFYSVNPGVVRLAGQATMQVHPSALVGIGYSHDLTGARHSVGYSLNTFLRLEPARWFGKTTSRRSSQPVDDFVPDNEDDGLKYFDRDPLQPKKKKKVRKRKRRPVKPNDDDNSL